MIVCLAFGRDLQAGGSESINAGAVGTELKVSLKGGEEMTFCWCPAGKFTMGSPEMEQSRGDDEGPVEVVLTEGFWMAQTPCTQGQWLALMGTTPEQQARMSAEGQRYGKVHELGAKLPMYFVNPADVGQFCEKLGAAVSLPAEWKAALPTEAQWEYACRAGTRTVFHFGNELDGSQANCDGGLPYGTRVAGPRLKKMCAVGLYKPNAWGLLDMHGNINQWCADGYDGYLPGGADPKGLSEVTLRVIRGGAWNSSPYECRAAKRGSPMPDDSRSAWIGFRPVLMSRNHSKDTVTTGTTVAAAFPDPVRITVPHPKAAPAVLAKVSPVQRAKDEEGHRLWDEAAELYGKGEYARAEERYREALTVFIVCWLPDAPMMTYTRMHIGQCLAAQHRGEEAVDELSLALILSDAKHSDMDRSFKLMGANFVRSMNRPDLIDDDMTLRMCYLLASVMADASKSKNDEDKAVALQDALPFANRCAKGWGESNGLDHADTKQGRELTRAIRAALYHMPLSVRKTQRRFSPLLPPLADLSEEAMAKLKKDSRAALDVADNLRWQAESEMSVLGDGKVKTPLTEAYAAYKRILGFDHALTLKCRAWLASMSAFGSNQEAGVKELRAVLAVLEQKFGKKDPWTNWTRQKLFNALIITLNKEETIALARTIVTSTTQIYGPKHPETLFALEQLGSQLYGAYRDVSAEKVFADLVPQLRSTFGSDDDFSIKCGEYLGHLQLQHGKPAEAAKSLTRLLCLHDTVSGHDGGKMCLDLAYSLNLLGRKDEALVLAKRAATAGDKQAAFTPSEDTKNAQVLLAKLSGKAPKSTVAEDAAEQAEVGGPSAADRIRKIGLEVVMEHAMLGEPGCQFLAGVYLGNGGGSEPSAEVGFNWALLAADSGNTEAQNYVTYGYTRGEGTKVDDALALKWIKKAIESGSAVAMYNMALRYANGKGVEKDPKQMLMWFERSAELGFVGSIRMLGGLYASGQYDVGRDKLESCRWYTVGAELDDAACLYSLGVNYYRGEGEPMNKGVAVELWRRAAEQGYADAQFKIGCAYMLGEVLVRDPQSAYFWFKLAAKQGHKESAKFATQVVSIDLTKSSLAEVTERIDRFKPRGPKPTSKAPTRKPAPKSPSGDGIASGTAFFITTDGYLVTNHHVIDKAKDIRVVMGTEPEVPATVVTSDKDADLAILKVDTKNKHTVLPIAPARGVKLGTSVATVGYPNILVQGLSPKLAKGEIASLAGLQDDPGQFQISVPLQPGNSGGSLVDSKGNVVGVVCAIMDQRVALATTGTLANSVSYAVKSSLLTNLIESVPGLTEKLAARATATRSFEDVVDDMEHATVLVLVKVKE